MKSPIVTFRGDARRAGQHLDGMEPWRHSEAYEPRWTYAACEATVALAGGSALGGALVAVLAAAVGLVPLLALITLLPALGLLAALTLLAVLGLLALLPLALAL